MSAPHPFNGLFTGPLQGAFGLGVANSVFEPLSARASNPVTAVALIGAGVSGVISLSLVLRAMVSTAPLV